MLFTTKNTVGKKVKVIDCMGKEVPAVCKYNSRTREATIFIKAKTSYVVVRAKGNKIGKVLKAKIKIPGSKIIVDGVTY